MVAFAFAFAFVLLLCFCRCSSIALHLNCLFFFVGFWSSRLIISFKELNLVSVWFFALTLTLCYCVFWLTLSNVDVIAVSIVLLHLSAQSRLFICVFCLNACSCRFLLLFYCCVFCCCIWYCVLLCLFVELVILLSLILC